MSLKVKTYDNLITYLHKYDCDIVSSKAHVDANPTKFVILKEKRHFQFRLTNTGYQNINLNIAL